MYPMTNENEFMITAETFFQMDDGIKLYTRISYPKGVSKCPIIFQRTLYEDAHNGIPHSFGDPETVKCVQNGFALVLQHCRGSGDSEGYSIPYAEEERKDGLKSLEYIRKLDIYNGEIYLQGQSYLASAHLTYLDTSPEDIKGISFQIQTDLQFYRNYRHGCCFCWTNPEWWFSVAQKTYPVINPEPVKKRPYIELSKRMTGKPVPKFDAQLINNTYTSFWDEDHRSNALSHFNCPVLLTEGWYDFYIDGMFSMWDRLPEKIRPVSAMVVGPYGHATAISDESEYDMPNGNIPPFYYVDWFKSIHNHTPFPYAELGKVKYYSIGKDKWMTTDFRSFGEPKRLFINADGTLSDTPCTGGKLSYIYNPSKRPDYFKHNGIFEAKPKKDGILSFESYEFEEEFSFFGRLRFHANVISNCDDTAFTIRLYFVENGKAYNLTDDITSLSYIDSDYKANSEITIDTYSPPIGFTVKKGCRLRIDIASDNDIYVPHANTKEHFAYAVEEKIATNTLICDENSFIELNLE